MDEFNNFGGVVAGWAVFFGIVALIIWTAHRVQAWQAKKVRTWSDLLDHADALLDVSAQRRVKG